MDSNCKYDILNKPEFFALSLAEPFFPMLCELILDSCYPLLTIRIFTLTVNPSYVIIILCLINSIISGSYLQFILAFGHCHWVIFHINVKILAHNNNTGVVQKPSLTPIIKLPLKEWYKTKIMKMYHKLCNFLRKFNSTDSSVNRSESN